MIPTPHIKIDVSRLNAAVAERLKYPGRTLAEAINTSAYYVALNTKRTTPYTAVSTVDSELGKFVVPQFLPRGRQGPTKRQKHGFGQGASRTKGVPLVALIIASRVRNPPLNPKWRIDKNPFKGVSRAAGAAAMKRIAMKMLKARRSSTHFLQSGWVGAVKMLRPLAKFRAGLPQDNSGLDLTTDLRGDAIPAKEGSMKAFAAVINRTGTAGPNAEETNDALFRYGSDALQQAVNQEERGLQRYIEKKYGEETAKFNIMCK